jgi:predicted nucleic acid-binding protein
MNRVLIDTNVIIDVLSARKPFFRSSQSLLSLADSGEIKAYSSALTFANAYYILRKQYTGANLRSVLKDFSELIINLDLTNHIIRLALDDLKFPDFEDGLQYYTALENVLDVIITRDLRDFKNSKIPVMSPNDYLARLDTLQ